MQKTAAALLGRRVAVCRGEKRAAQTFIQPPPACEQKTLLPLSRWKPDTEGKQHNRAERQQENRQPEEEEEEEERTLAFL